MKLGIGIGMGYSKFRGGIVNNAFIIEVKTDEAGDSSNDQFQFTGGQGEYDVVAKQNDIVVQTFNDLSDEATITFANGAGTYVLEVNAKATNDFNIIDSSGGGDIEKILDIITYGQVNWTFISFFNGRSLKSIGDRVYNGEGITSFFRSFINVENTPAISIREDFFWNCPNVTSFNQTFNSASNNLIFSPRLFEKCTLVEDYTSCFRELTLPTETYSKMIINLEATNIKDNVLFGGGNSKYDPTISDASMGSNLTTAQALTNLNNRGWAFSDNGPI
jgi:hypothetical protein